MSAILDRLLGPRCPICGERTRWLKAHTWVEHGEVSA